MYGRSVGSYIVMWDIHEGKNEVIEADSDEG